MKKVAQAFNLIDSRKSGFNNPEDTRTFSPLGLFPALKTSGNKLLIDLKSLPQQNRKIIRIGTFDRRYGQNGLTYSPEGLAPTVLAGVHKFGMLVVCAKALAL